MTPDQFVAACKLDTLSEVEKSCHLAFYFLKSKDIEEFSASDCAKWIDDLSLAKPNTSRLSKRLKESHNTVRGSVPSKFRLQHAYLKKLEALFP